MTKEMNLYTAQEREQEFRDDLSELLKKHLAVITFIGDDYNYNIYSGLTKIKLLDDNSENVFEFLL